MSILEKVPASKIARDSVAKKDRTIESCQNAKKGQSMRNLCLILAERAVKCIRSTVAYLQILVEVFGGDGGVAPRASSVFVVQSGVMRGGAVGVAL
jgi:hypothetical protein